MNINNIQRTSTQNIESLNAPTKSLKQGFFSKIQEVTSSIIGLVKKQHKEPAPHGETLFNPMYDGIHAKNFGKTINVFNGENYKKELISPYAQYKNVDKLDANAITGGVRFADEKLTRL